MDRLMKLDDVLRIVPVSSTTWRNWSRVGSAPQKVKLGRSTFWRESDIRAFIAGEWKPEARQDSPHTPAS